MAVAFRAAGTAASGLGAQSPGLPAGWQADDIHILAAVRDQPTSFSVPSGWTSIFGGAVTSGSWLYAVVCWRRAVGGDTAPSIGTGLDGFIARIFGFSGCLTSATPIDAPTNPANINNGSNPKATNTFDPSEANEMMVALDLSGSDSTGSTPTTTSDNGDGTVTFTERGDDVFGGGAGKIHLGCYTGGPRSSAANFTPGVAITYAAKVQVECRNFLFGLKEEPDTGLTLPIPPVSASAAGLAPGVTEADTITLAQLTAAGLAPAVVETPAIAIANVDAAGLAPTQVQADTLPIGVAAAAGLPTAEVMLMAITQAVATAEGVAVSAGQDLSVSLPAASIAAAGLTPGMTVGLVLTPASAIARGLAPAVEGVLVVFGSILAVGDNAEGTTVGDNSVDIVVTDILKGT